MFRGILCGRMFRTAKKAPFLPISGGGDHQSRSRICTAAISAGTQMNTMYSEKHSGDVV